MTYLGYTTNNEFRIITLNNIIEHANQWANINNREEEYIQRLETVIRKIKIIEQIQITNKDKKINIRKNNNEEYNDYLAIQIYDFGGQEKFYIAYKGLMKQIQGIMFVRSTDNTIQSELALRQLYEMAENTKQRESYTYLLTKKDLFYINNEKFTEKDPFEDDLSIFEKPDSIMPVSTFLSWEGNIETIAALGSLLLKNIEENRKDYILGIAGSGGAGKTALLRRVLATITNNPLIAEKTKMTIGTNGFPLKINSSIFYAKDKNNLIYFLNNEGEAKYAIRLDKFTREGGIKELTKYSIINEKWNEGEKYTGGKWGIILDELLNEKQVKPIYDLKIIGRIAQFMKPKAWGLEGNEEPFKDNTEYLKENFNRNRELYRQEENYFIN